MWPSALPTGKNKCCCVQNRWHHDIHSVCCSPAASLLAKRRLYSSAPSSCLAVNRHGSTLALAQADKALATVICNIVCLFDVVHTVVIWCYVAVHTVLSVCVYVLSPLEATGCLQGLLWRVRRAKLHQALWKTHKPHFAASFFFSCCLCYYFRWIVF